MCRIKYVLIIFFIYKWIGYALFSGSWRALTHFSFWAFVFGLIKFDEFEHPSTLHFDTILSKITFLKQQHNFNILCTIWPYFCHNYHILFHCLNVYFYENNLRCFNIIVIVSVHCSTLVHLEVQSIRIIFYKVDIWP